jgi:TonB family protein
MTAPPEIEIPRPIRLEISSPEISRGLLVTPSIEGAVPGPASKAVIKISGFQSEETLAAGPVRSTTSRVVDAAGSFDSASAAEGRPVSNRMASVRSGAFSETSIATSSGRGQGAITSGAFADTTVEKSLRQTAARQTAIGAFTMVEILSKPTPAYTKEARMKNIEGEVLLEMQFCATGEARVLRMVRGLGAGLDESAVAAARGIRFRPATRDGGAVDFDAIVHIVFQLAN